MKSTQAIVALAAVLALGITGVASAHDNRDRGYRDNHRHSHYTQRYEHGRKAHRAWRKAQRAERRYWRAHRREVGRGLHRWRAHQRRDWHASQRYARDYRQRDSVTFWVDGVRFHITDAR
jgi:hypothetical protein